MLVLMATSFVAGLILSTVPPYHVVAYAGAAYFGLTVLSFLLSIVLGILAASRKSQTDIVWSCVLFGFSAGPMAVPAIGGCIFDHL